MLHLDGTECAVHPAGPDLESVFEGRNIGPGRANPVKLAALRPGEAVLVLGAGGGRDCFAAAEQVGKGGRVFGVEMAPDLVAHARGAARRSAVQNVEFRLGEAVHPPLADACVDVVIANCVVDIAVDQEAVFREAFRVLRPGGRIAFSDVVAISPIVPITEEIAPMFDACVDCVVPPEQIRRWLEGLGFERVRVVVDLATHAVIRDAMPAWARWVASASIEATKPGG